MSATRPVKAVTKSVNPWPRLYGTKVVVNQFTDWLLIASGILFVIQGISWLTFSRLTMARIEREIRQGGENRPAAWDGIGYRALSYARAIAFPLGFWNSKTDPLIDVIKVRKFATPFDRMLSRIFLFSGYAFLIVVLITAVRLGAW